MRFSRSNSPFCQVSYKEFDKLVQNNNYTKKGVLLVQLSNEEKELYKRMDNIKVIAAQGAAVDVAMLHECKAIVRGLRSLSDYDYEVQLAEINRDISNNQVNTVCLFADKEYQFISSSVVKEVFSLGKDISSYVDESIERKLIMKRGD